MAMTPLGPNLSGMSIKPLLKIQAALIATRLWRHSYVNAVEDKTGRVPL